MASTNPNGLRVVLPNAGGGFAVQGSEIYQNTITDANLAANTITAASIANATITDAKMVANTLTNASIAANTIGSGQLDANTLQLATLTLTPTQIKAMYATPVQVIAAPGAGKSIVVKQALARFAYTAPAYAAGGAVVLQYDNTANGAGTAACNTLAAAVVTATASSDTVVETGASNITATQNKGIFVSNDTAAFTTGTVSTLTLYVWYSIV